mgnify:CR=1 FL=1
MDTINVNGETYTKVPDEISLFGRTYLLADDTIPEPLDVSDWHPIEPDYRITLREYMTQQHPEDAKRNLTGLGQVVKNVVLNAGKGDLLEENSNGAIITPLVVPAVEQATGSGVTGIMPTLWNGVWRKHDGSEISQHG